MTKQKVDKRRILLFLPLIMLPFLALAFYALGGGRQAPMPGKNVAKGINTVLPDAQFKKEVPTDKMGIYELTKGDTSRTDDNAVKDVAGKLGFDQSADPQTRQINEKLAAINKQISAPVTPSPGYKDAGKNPAADDALVSKDVARLEKMMKSMQQSGDGNDPEMAQLNSLMDKILDAQNPGRARDRIAKVTARVPDSLFKAIPAIIDGRQKIVEGASVKMRLMDTMTVNTQIIPKGTVIYGLATISNQRLNLEIKNIGLGNAIIPVNITVFDKKDAMIGLYAPEAVVTDAISGGTDNALQSMQFIGGMDQSLGIQAAGAGITAAKGLFSKKVKRIKIKLEDNRAVLLRDNTRKINP